MPSINRDAKSFEMNRAHWFAFAVKQRRTALRLTAAELSRRTAGLGYPISRGAIAKIESQARSGKIDVAEVLVLARALDVPPALLLFPGFATDGPEELLPGYFARSDDAVRWVAGSIAYPQEYELSSMRRIGDPAPPNSGVNLVEDTSLLAEALETRTSLVRYLERVEGDAQEVENAHEMLQRNAEQIAAIRHRRRNSLMDLWGMHPSLGDREDDNDE
ncbi:helix-turn-helix domain-containing protein [[Mycobacterium] crassicus]|uniref:Helix-turn-helix transcriptional regulator n=1 Tax=[Mycobacterium] crassicus TaxID=2872309 RepID=A0ABU5XDM7_9MYCO|nr:helix-turn-helix transcriptional regulator [Mycolicibacter sp. MYC098]MEB3020392.1 helix-turn-helix transcriptional regulator [Mycolicibacter sp. MYC098]